MPTLDQLGIHPATLGEISDLVQRAEIARESGFRSWGLRGIEIEAFLRGGQSIEDLVHVSSSNGLRISDAGALNDWQWTGHPPLVNRRPDPATHTAKELWALVEVFLDRCAAIGVPTIVASGPGSRSGEFKEAVISFRQICDRAQSYGLRVAYEMHGTVSGRGTFDHAWRIVDAAGRDNGGLMLDAFHFHVGGSTVQHLAEIPAARVFLVRLSDVGEPRGVDTGGGDRVMPGRGVIPLRDIVNWLERQGYTGFYTVEVGGSAVHGRSVLEVAVEAFQCGAAVLGLPG